MLSRECGGDVLMTTSVYQSALVDEITVTGEIIRCEPEQAATLGYLTKELVGASWSKIYPIASRRLLEQHLARQSTGPIPEVLQIKDAKGNMYDVAAIVDVRDDDVAGRTVRVFKWVKADFIVKTEQLNEDKEILEDIVAASDDPGWCMEFLEPVDLSAPEQEIVRQVFSNRRRWRFCNAAMARFYRLPEGIDLNERPVEEIFPQSPENEDFVRLLIRSNFDLARGISLDTRYDGVQQVVENDVRGLIRNNQLFRMWGTVRDVSQHHRRAEELKRRIAELEMYLSAIPDALILLDESGAVVHLNTAAFSLFGCTSAQIDDISYDRLVGKEVRQEALIALIDKSQTDALRQCVHSHIRSADRRVAVDVNARRFVFSNQVCLVVTFRASLTSPGETTQAPHVIQATS